MPATKLHLKCRGGESPVCTYRRGAPTTTDKTKVTCKKCLDMIKKGRI